MTQRAGAVRLDIEELRMIAGSAEKPEEQPQEAMGSDGGVEGKFCGVFGSFKERA